MAKADPPSGMTDRKARATAKTRTTATTTAKQEQRQQQILRFAQDDSAVWLRTAIALFGMTILYVEIAWGIGWLVVCLLYPC